METTKIPLNSPNQEACTSVNTSVSFGSTFLIPRRAGMTIVGKATEIFNN